MKEINCKISSTWSDDDRTKDSALRTGSIVMEDGKLSQLDCIIGPEGRHHCHICKEGKLWNSWDHHPIYVRIDEGRDAEQFARKRKKNGCGWAPKTVKPKN